MDYKKIWSEVITASLIVIISAIAIISFIVISEQDVDIYNPSDKIAVSKGTDKISEVLNLVQSKYMGELDVDQLIEGAIEGIFENIDDPYTRYLTEEEFNEAINSGEEEYSGIGIHMGLSVASGQVKIIGVMPDSPAEKAGLKSGDVIVKVDDTDITKDNYFEASEQIKGEAGTEVKMVVKRAGKELTYTIVRDNIVSNNISSDIIDKTNIGYIKILSFERGIYSQFKEAYNELLNEDKVEGLIVDLRDNPGGFVDETVKIADLLCPEGLIIKEEYGDGTIKTFTSKPGKCEIPLVVLVNENSASASEILVAALQENEKAIIVGDKTYGKGVIQELITLSDGSGIKITVEEYYTPNRNKINEVGVEPDEKVSLPQDVEDIYNIDRKYDTQLQKAIEILKK